MITMTEAEFQEKLEQAAEAGATRALTKVGLQDEHAGRDVSDIRSILRTWRFVKENTARSFITRIADIFIAALLLGFAWKIGLIVKGG